MAGICRARRAVSGLVMRDKPHADDLAFARIRDLSKLISPDLTQLEKRLMSIVSKLNEQVDAAIARLVALEAKVAKFGDLAGEIAALKAELTEITLGVASATDKLDAAVPDGGQSMGGVNE